MADFLQILFYLLFFLSGLVLILIVLLQEGKGGGLSDAFGTAGTETFGVRAGGVNRFTFAVFAVWILSCMVLLWTGSGPKSVLGDDIPESGVVGSGEPGGGNNGS